MAMMFRSLLADGGVAYAGGRHPHSHGHDGEWQSMSAMNGGLQQTGRDVFGQRRDRWLRSKFFT